MISLQINTTDINQAKEIINFLMDEKLLYNPTFAEQQKFQKNDKNGKLESSIQILIRGQTKALLFDKINHQLAQKYPEQPPLLYALPIVYMDDIHSEILKKKIKS